MTRGVEQKVYENAGNLPLLELLPAKKGRVLDCGCGAGDNARLLSSRGWRVTGITLSPVEQRRASEYCDEVYVADLEQNLPGEISDRYDVVLLSHVLEHLVHPENVLEAAKRVLAPDGMIAVALPNVLFYPIRMRALLGRFEYAPGGIMDETHVRFYTFETGAELLRKNGFEVVVARADGGVPLWKLRNLLPASFVERLGASASRRWPGLFGRQSLYLARPCAGSDPGPERSTSGRERTSR